jgi:hypothetical protein
MAKMYPSQLPDRVLNDKSLRGEIKTYEALAALPDEFEVFYNRCVSADQTASAHERPIDFIVLHEVLGFLAIEVKGGSIRIGRDGGVEQYQFTKGDWAPIDPYGQVKKSTIALIRNVKADGANYWITDNIGVIFPETHRHEITDTPQYLPNGTLCADDLPILQTQIKMLYATPKNGNAWQRSDFLDMRRRLQNMPEAPRGSSSFKNDRKTRKDYFKSTKTNSAWKEKDVPNPIPQSLQRRPKWQTVILYGVVAVTTLAVSTLGFLWVVRTVMSLSSQ